MAKPKKMQETTLKTLLASERTDALAGYSASRLVQDRSRALDYYNGKMDNDMPVPDGRSSAVSTDVADTVEGLMPSLMEIFTAGDEVVKFEPVGPEDEPAAEQETDYVNHVFMQQNDGFMILYQMIKDALISKVGLVKVWSEKETKESKETYYDQPEEALMMLASNPEIEITEHTVKPSGLHDVTIVQRKDVVKHKVANVPPEEFGISRSARSIRDSGYCFHEVYKRESQAIDEGFDEDQVKALPTRNIVATGLEALARDTVEDSVIRGGDTGMNSANRIIKITEHYINMDYEGTGKACLYKIVTGGEQGDILKRDGKLAIDEIDAMPFAAMCPIPQPHRFFGHSVADVVIEIQKIKTALTRAMLDNAYLANNQRYEVAESGAGSNTLDDLLTSRPGGIVRTKQIGSVAPLGFNSIADKILPMLGYFDETREWRTGVTRQGQGVDADALQNQSATAVNQSFTAAQARMKLIARIFAETGIRDLFLLLHGTIRKHGSTAETVRLRNQWIQVDPRDWKERNDMTVNVGLGTGSKSERVAHLMAIINLQSQALAAGKSNLVQDDKLFNAGKELCKLLDYKNAEMFFSDPAKMPPPPEPVNPEMEKLKMQAGLKQQENAQKAEIEKVQAQADIATNDRKINAEIMAAREKAQTEKELAIMEFNMTEARDQREHEYRMAQLAQKAQFDAEAHARKMEAAAVSSIQSHEAHEQKLEAAAFKGAD